MSAPGHAKGDSRHAQHAGAPASTADDAPNRPLPDALRWAIDAACRDLVARAARLSDQGQHAALAALFTEDAVLVRPGGSPLQGRAAIAASYSSRPPTRLTRHLVASTVVDVAGADAARAFSTVLLVRGSTADPSSDDGRAAQGPWVVGEFEDLLTRSAEGVWLIQRREARFVLHSLHSHLPG